MQGKSRQKRKNALLEKNFKDIFSTVFLLKLLLSDPYYVSTEKKRKMFILYFFKYIKKRFFS
jgi:hypothetical protein